MSSVQWCAACEGNVPTGGYVGGYDITGEPIYVARAKLDNAVLPGKLVPSQGGTYISWGNKEHLMKQYEVLIVGPYNWVAASGKDIPQNSIIGGNNKNGENNYIGRVKHEGSLTTGRVELSLPGCYIPFGNKEISFKDYEILTH